MYPVLMFQDSGFGFSLMRCGSLVLTLTFRCWVFVFELLFVSSLKRRVRVSQISAITFVLSDRNTAFYVALAVLVLPRSSKVSLQHFSQCNAMSLNNEQPCPQDTLFALCVVENVCLPLFCFEAQH